MKYIKRATRLALSCLSIVLIVVLVGVLTAALSVAVLAFSISILDDYLAE